jgi:hypothetical protein
MTIKTPILFSKLLKEKTIEILGHIREFYVKCGGQRKPNWEEGGERGKKRLGGGDER